MAWNGRQLLAAAALGVVLALAGCHGKDDHDQPAPGGPLVPDTGAVAPIEVRMTWFGISNWTFKIGDLNILMDGYTTRIPQDYFFGGGGGLAYTKAAWPIDKAGVDRLNTVLRSAPGSPVKLLITGHSHFDHSFDPGARRPGFAMHRRVWRRKDRAEQVCHHARGALEPQRHPRNQSRAA
jgi:hypothetical protein